MGKELTVYDPSNHLLLDFDGEILREGVVLRTVKQINRFREISNKEVDKLSSNEVAGMIRSIYGFQGVRIPETLPVFKGLNNLLDSMGNNVSQAHKNKIQSIYLRLSTKQGLLKSPKKHCRKWMDFLDVDFLQLNSKSEVYRFKTILQDYSIVRKGSDMLVANPLLGYNNTILFLETYLAFKDKIELPYIVRRYFELGYDSVLNKHKKEEL